MNPPSELNNELIKRRNELEKNIKLITKQQQSLSKNGGSLFIKENENYIEYYHETHSPKRKRTYIKKQDRVFAQQLAQKSYYDEILPRLQSELKLLNNYLTELPNYHIEDTYTQYKKSRKELVIPIAISDEEYATRWQEQPYIPKPFLETDTTRYYTNKDERVRSKSEMSIANYLKDQNIPYKYECPLKLEKSVYPSPIYPDFTILNKRTRKIYYLEHLGSMDDIDYITKNLPRFRDYERNGIILGDNLLVTYESGKLPFDITFLKTLAQIFFL